MPVHVEQVTTDIAFFDGDLPLGDAQIRKLVALVAAHIEQTQRDSAARREATDLERRSVVPGAGGRG
jgi:hypothetical protein